MPTSNKIAEAIADRRDTTPPESALEGLGPRMTEAEDRNLLREQRGDVTALQSQFDRLDAEIETLSDLKADLASERIGAAREKVEPLIAEILGRIRDRRDTAKAQRRWWTPYAWRRLARFDPGDPVADATIRSAWASRLAAASFPDLIEYARDAAGTPDVALLEMVRAETARRPDAPGVLRDEVDGLVRAFDRIAPQPAEMQEALAEVERLAEVAELRVAESSGDRRRSALGKLRVGLADRAAGRTGAEVLADAERQAADGSTA